ncbi:dethiobiotin synthase [Alteromonas oceanisediminis]|uniref:dethiobiotin synthase n=1 Tax=Alteromonas oceanisediminis TaxID=2836180 RepID=UPI001BD9B87D|nr:dethiobiotin synthase [Alteromonas oceanisediminis]MBT0587631.1 dethiobiotin synthase [Alteromonas oceanisediminis]
MQSLFVTGTDTDVGKTVVTGGLLKAFATRGLSTLGYKPIAAGCESTPRGLENADALFLQHCSSVRAPLIEVNPVTYAPPIAPHIAATLAEQPIASEQVIAGWHQLASYQPDVLITEGAGGWALPISHQDTFPSILRQLPLRVILVVGMRLGCLNHALLTASAVRADGFELAGWVANHLSATMPYLQDNIDTLSHLLGAPLLGQVPYLNNDPNNPFEHTLGAEQYLDIAPLLVGTG